MKRTVNQRDQEKGVKLNREITETLATDLHLTSSASGLNWFWFLKRREVKRREESENRDEARKG